MKGLMKPIKNLLFITILLTFCTTLTACEMMTAAEQPAEADKMVTPAKKTSVSKEELHDLNTQLKEAVHIGSHNEKLVTDLLDKGADVNVTDAYGRTPLMRAVERNKITIIRILLQRGANVKSKDEMGRSAMDRAEEIGNNAVIDLLKEYE